MLAHGNDKPSQRAMELIAAATGEEPGYFVEYRLMKAMDKLNPEVVGFSRALANLNRRMSRRPK